MLGVEDDRVVGEGVFGDAYEGPPGCVHGGFIAGAFDEVLGFTMSFTGLIGMTGRLTVHYRQPTPLHRPLRFEGRVDRVDGRKIFTRASLHADGVLRAEAEGLFIAVDPLVFERLMEARDEYRGPVRVAARPPRSAGQQGEQAGREAAGRERAQHLGQLGFGRGPGRGQPGQLVVGADGVLGQGRGQCRRGPPGLQRDEHVVGSAASPPAPADPRAARRAAGRAARGRRRPRSWPAGRGAPRPACPAARAPPPT